MKNIKKFVPSNLSGLSIKEIGKIVNIISIDAAALSGACLHNSEKKRGPVCKIRSHKGLSQNEH